MTRIYVETNFVVGTAFGRERNVVRLLSADAEQVQICLPEVCIIEAFSAFEDEQKRRNRFTNELQQQVTDVGRRMELPNAAPLLTALEAAFLSNQEFLRDIKARMDELVAQLLGLRSPLAGAELLSLQPTYGPDAFTQVGPPPEIADQPTDTLILRVTCADALRYPDARKAFLSGNTRDFNNEEVRGFLAACGVRYFSTTDALLGWLDSNGVGASTAIVSV